MDPVFTLQWPELVIADRLQKMLPKSKGYSVLIPVSRQEKGFDLAITLRRANGHSTTATIQIKASRTYLSKPPMRESTVRYQFQTWFNRFEVPKEADFFLLFGTYAPDTGRTFNIKHTWYQACTLLFTRKEMKQFMSTCLTVGGTYDKMFGFGFDNDQQIIQTRGDQKRRFKDYTDHLLENRIDIIENFLKK